MWSILYVASMARPVALRLHLRRGASRMETGQQYRRKTILSSGMPRPREDQQCDVSTMLDKSMNSARIDRSGGASEWQGFGR